MFATSSQSDGRAPRVRRSVVCDQRNELPTDLEEGATHHDAGINIEVERLHEVGTVVAVRAGCSTRGSPCRAVKVEVLEEAPFEMDLWMGEEIREQARGIGLSFKSSGPTWHILRLVWVEMDGVWTGTWTWIVDDVATRLQDCALERALDQLDGKLIPMELLRMIAHAFVEGVMEEYGLDNDGNDPETRWLPMPY